MHAPPRWEKQLGICTHCVCGRFSEGSSQSAFKWCSSAIRFKDRNHRFPRSTGAPERNEQPAIRPGCVREGARRERAPWTQRRLPGIGWRLSGRLSPVTVGSAHGGGSAPHLTDFIGRLERGGCQITRVDWINEIRWMNSHKGLAVTVIYW